MAIFWSKTLFQSHTMTEMVINENIVLTQLRFVACLECLKFCGCFSLILPLKVESIRKQLAHCKREKK